MRFTSRNGQDTDNFEKRYFPRRTHAINKGKKDYVDVDKKDALFAAQGHVMGFSGEITTNYNQQFK